MLSRTNLKYSHPQRRPPFTRNKRILNKSMGAKCMRVSPKEFSRISNHRSSANLIKYRSRSRIIWLSKRERLRSSIALNNSPKDSPLSNISTSTAPNIIHRMPLILPKISRPRNSKATYNRAVTQGKCGMSRPRVRDQEHRRPIRVVEICNRDRHLVAWLPCYLIRKESARESRWAKRHPRTRWETGTRISSLPNNTNSKESLATQVMLLRELIRWLAKDLAPQARATKRVVYRLWRAARTNPVCRETSNKGVSKISSQVKVVFCLPLVRIRPISSFPQQPTEPFIRIPNNKAINKRRHRWFHRNLWKRMYSLSDKLILTSKHSSKWTKFK